jgi:hypothetical protein
MAFTYKLEEEDGTPADPPTFRSAVPTWQPGDLRVIEARPASDHDENPVLVVATA